MRGRQKLYTNVLKKKESSPNAGKGRSAELLRRRNALIASRYYYYIRIKRKNYDDTLAELENEFFLSQHTVTAILLRDEYTVMIRELIAESISSDTLKISYPHFVW